MHFLSSLEYMSRYLLKRVTMPSKHHGNATTDKTAKAEEKNALF